MNLRATFLILVALILRGVSHPYRTVSRSFQEISLIVSSRPPSVEPFLQAGPLDVEIKRDFEIPLDTVEKVNTDIYIPIQEAKAPLLIIQHGNRSFQEFSRRAGLSCRHLGCQRYDGGTAQSRPLD